MQRNIIEIIGRPALLEQLAEECSELAQASLKLARILRGENPTPTTEQEAFSNVIEELSDISLCADALEIDPDYNIMQQKEKRWENRIKEMTGRKKDSKEDVITCGECRFRIDHHYEEPGDKPYIKSNCGCRYGLTKDYQVHPTDFCSRGRKGDEGKDAD